MRTELTKAAAQVQSKYNAKFDKNIRQVPVFEEGGLLYLNINLSSSNQNAKDLSRKLRVNKTSPKLIVGIVEDRHNGKRWIT